MDTRVVVQIAIALVAFSTRYNFAFPALALDTSMVKAGILQRVIMFLPVAITVYALYYAFLRKADPKLWVAALLILAMFSAVVLLVGAEVAVSGPPN